MKKLSILCLSALALGMTFTSCSKDDNEAASIEGKWTMEKYSYSIDNGKTFTDEAPENTPGCSKDYVEVLAGGVFKTISYGDKCVVDQSVGTWSQKENMLTTFIDGDTEVSNIESVTSTNLKLKSTYTDSETKISIIAITAFTKI